jgi:hypothetical protein
MSIKTPDKEKKIYEVIKDKFFDDAGARNYDKRKTWEKYLESVGIEPCHVDHSSDAVGALMELINSGRDVFVCPDPWIYESEEFEGDGFLEVPTELAEKILVLGKLP